MNSTPRSLIVSLSGGTTLEKIMVTGGAGFIGSVVCRYLVQEKKCQVLNLDKLTYAGVPESLKEIEENDLCRFAQADVCDAENVASLFSEFQPDAVMHLAAESHENQYYGHVHDAGMCEGILGGPFQ